MDQIVLPVVISDEERKIQPDKPPYLQVVNYNGPGSKFLLLNNAVRVHLPGYTEDDPDFYGELNVKKWRLRIWSAFDDGVRIDVDLSSLIAPNKTRQRVK